MGQFIDLNGKRFGRLVVVKRGEDHFTKSGARITMWDCVCDCGNTRSIAGLSLRKGVTLSCGCYSTDAKRERIIKWNKRTAKYSGCSKERLFHIWKGIMHRCYNQKDECYKDYGGRGITVCDEWKNDYTSFRTWAFENGYDESAKYGNCTIDRIDNEKGYSPENCRRATAAEQANNRRSNVIISAFGKTQNLKAWADETGIKYGTLRTRIVKMKWNAERALTEPVRGAVEP